VDVALVRLTPGAAGACGVLKGLGLVLVVVSNQGAVARGRCTVDGVNAVNDAMLELLRREGVEIDGVYFCPYHPEGTGAPFDCEHHWRKPGAGMFLGAARDLEIDLANSWSIGDSERDVRAAVGAGIPADRALLIGEGASHRGLPEAAGHIASRLGRAGAAR
jgi:D-glycero-D-manno-heptose 1,7-bisphosphate phosphatase